MGTNSIANASLDNSVRASIQAPRSADYYASVVTQGDNSVVKIANEPNEPSVKCSNQDESQYSKLKLEELIFYDGTIRTTTLSSVDKKLTLYDGTNTCVLSTTGLTFNDVPVSASGGGAGSAGATGATGSTGDRGETGLKGDTGDKGEAGDTGSVGPTGNTGSMGLKGDVGSTGSTGSTGSKGDTGGIGDKGEVYVVFTWPEPINFKPSRIEVVPNLSLK
jgi:hypothetical protein